MKTYSIRQAQITDCPLIRELAGKTWADTYGTILSEEQLDWMFDWMYSISSLETQMANGHTFFLLLEGDEAVGYVSVEQETEGRYHLQKLYTLPEKQGQGLGKRLLEQAESFARECKPEGRLELALNVNRENKKAIAFYKRNGFVVERSGDFDIGHGFFMQDYILVKLLRAG